MADYSITISNSVNAFGPESTNTWGGSWGAVWGQFLWGYGNVGLVTTTGKLISEALVCTDQFEIAVYFYLSISNTLTPSGDMDSESLTDGSGYSYVFPSDTTEAEDRDFPTWTSGAAGSQSFTCQAAGSTTWS